MLSGDFKGSQFSKDCLKYLGIESFLLRFPLPLLYLFTYFENDLFCRKCVEFLMLFISVMLTLHRSIIFW